MIKNESMRERVEDNELFYLYQRLKRYHPQRLPFATLALNALDGIGWLWCTLAWNRDAVVHVLTRDTARFRQSRRRTWISLGVIALQVAALIGTLAGFFPGLTVYAAAFAAWCFVPTLSWRLEAQGD